jgi:flagellar biosynthetic protein FlhB
MARQLGQAAHSPELTAAAGWLAAVVVLALAGDHLTIGLTELVRGSLSQPVRIPDDATAIAGHVRQSIVGLAWPLATILGGFAGGAFAVHQIQVRGLWATSQIVPDPSRLWRFSKGPGISVLFAQSSWSLAKGVILVAIAACALGAGWSDFLRQSSLEGPELARAAGHIVVRVSSILAGGLLALGLVDYVLRYRRFEAMLRTSPAEQREDQRVMEGDPAAQALRRRAARSMRGDAPDLLIGAALVLTGPAGLTLVIAGGPPPKRVTIRNVAKGGSGLRLRRKAEASGIPRVDDAALAQRLARRPASGTTIAAELITELAAIWPAS